MGALEGEKLCKGGNCRDGVAFFEAALQAGTDDFRTLSAIYSQLGNAYFYMGDYVRAMQYHKHDLTLARTMGDRLGEAKASGNLGNTLKVMGKPSSEKNDWNLPQPKMAVTDLSKLLKSEEIQKVLRAPNRKANKAVVKKNPLKNVRAMLQLNPYAAVLKKNAELVSAKRIAEKAANAAKIAGKKPAADPMAKRRAAVMKKSGKGKMKK